MDQVRVPPIKAAYALGYITGYALGVTVAIIAARTIISRMDAMNSRQSRIASQTAQLHTLLVGQRYERKPCPGGCR